MFDDVTKYTFDYRDEFQRETVADRIITLLTSKVKISPMLIDGDWGTGKTEFCHKLINKFKSQHGGYELIYIDAFKADHANEPLMTILGAIYNTLLDSKNSEERKSFMQKSLSVLRTGKQTVPVLSFGLKTLFKALIGHLCRQNADDVLTGFQEEIRNAANVAIDATIAGTLKDHASSTKNIESLQNVLSEITKTNSIVMFVDELDRCRPDFAVQMLEVIKHIFDVDGVQFVLIANTKQLMAAINHRYGMAVDSKRYLDKFLRFRCELPNILPERGNIDVPASVEHFMKLGQSSTSLKNTDLLNTDHAVCDIIKLLIRKHRLSLREVETFVQALEIYQVITDEILNKSNYISIFYRVIGVFCYCTDWDLAQSIVENRADASKMEAFLDFSNEEAYNLGDWFSASRAMLILGCSLRADKFSKLSANLTLLSDIPELYSYREDKKKAHRFVANTIREISLHKLYD